MISPRAIVLATICIVALAAIITARQPNGTSTPASPASTDAAAPMADAPIASEPVEAAAASPRTAEPKATASLADRRLPVEPKPAPKPVEKPKPVEPVAVDPPAKALASLPPAPAAKAEEPLTHASPTAPLVTITGCVKREDDGFWLKDTKGEDAPKSRSWKFGFLKKRAASIYLVDSRDGVRLDDYVGRRVAATGTLVDREMKPRSIRQVAAVCD